MISELRLIYIIMCGNSDVYVIMDDCRLRELQIRLLTGRSKSRQCGDRGTSLESTSSSRLQPRQRREVDTAGLAPHTSILMSDTHASCSQSLLVVLNLRRAAIALLSSSVPLPQHDGGE